LTADKYSGVGNDVITITASINGTIQRYCTLIINIGGHESNITITQDEAFTVALNHIDTITTPQPGEALFSPLPTFEATCTGTGTATIYWACYNSSHILQNAGSENIVFTSGTHTYTITSAMTPNTWGVNFDFRIGKTTSYSLTSNHFEILP
jgi:hypothetical protein